MQYATPPPQKKKNNKKKHGPQFYAPNSFSYIQVIRRPVIC